MQVLNTAKKSYIRNRVACSAYGVEVEINLFRLRETASFYFVYKCSASSIAVNGNPLPLDGI